MLLINHPESGGQSTTPAIATPDNVEANDPSEDGEISEHAPNSPTHRILIISGHSINRIEPNIYADDFNIVYTHDDIKRIVDQLLEQSVPLNTMSLEDARDSLITYFQSNHTIAIPSTKDQHTLLLHNEMYPH
ncbi:hypothetical protein QVD99_008120 [Batrachochytrium dendrobatidis]|nr:hypothetical protein QVD99_008120 [Batrachochytrium dendrobatidis]